MRKITLLTSCLFLSAIAQNASAAVQYWDPNGTTSVGGNGTWDITTKNWTAAGTSTQVASASLVVFAPANAAGFCAGPTGGGFQGTFTISVNSAVTVPGIFAGGLNPGPSAVTFSGSGSLNFAAGADGVLSPVTSPTGITFSVPITGSGQILPQGGGPIVLNSGNTFTGGFAMEGSNTISFATGSAFGTGTLSLGSVGNGSVLVALGSTNITIANPVVLSNNTANIFSNSAPVTYSGVWNLMGHTLTFTNCNTNTISGVISNGAVTACGSGANSLLIFSGANVYTGATIVNSGLKLQGTAAGSIQGPVTISSGLLDATVAGAIAGSSVTVNTGATLELDNASTMSSPLVVLTLPASPANGMVNLNFSGTQNILALYYGTTSLAPGTYGAPSSGATFTSSVFSGSGILNVIVSPSTLSYWDPSPSLDAIPGHGGTGSWDTTTSDWFTGSSDTVFPSGTAAEFAGTAGTVTVNANLTPGGLTFATAGYTVTGSSSLNLTNPVTPINIPAGTTTIACPLTGQGAVVSGAGTLVLSGANTYTNGTTITNGSTLSVSSIGDSGTSSIGTGPVTLSGGSITYTGAGDTTARNFLGTTATTNIIDVPTNVTVTLNGRVTGSGGWFINKVDTGTLILGGAAGDNAFTGMNVNAGTVILNKTTSGHAIGNPLTIANNATVQLQGSGYGQEVYSGTTVAVNSGGLFDMNGQNSTHAGTTLSGTGIGGSGAVINSATGTTSVLAGPVTLAANTTIGGAGSPGGVTLSGLVSGDFALTYNASPGTLTLTGTNTFNGGLFVNAGDTVLLNCPTGIGAGTGPIVLGAGSTLGVNIGVANDAIANPIVGPSTAIVNFIESSGINLQVNSDMSAFTGVMNCPASASAAKVQVVSTTFSISPSATINVAAGGTFYVVNPGVVIPCPINLFGLGNTEVYGALRLESGAVISGPVNLLGNTTMGNNAAVANFGTISGVISGAYGITFTKVGGVILLSGNNTYSGTNVFNGCIVRLGSAENPGVSGPLGEPSAAGSMVCNGGEIQFTSVNHYDYSSRFSTNSTNYVFDENGQAVTFASPMTGTNANFTNVSSVAGGLLILSAANTYSNITALVSGTVQLAGPDTPGVSGPLGAATKVGSIVLSGGTLQYAAANGAHDYSSRFSTAASQSYNIDVNGQNVTFATPLISSAGQVTLTSSTAGGSLSLSGTNNYTGATTINPGGTLTISGAGSLGATNTGNKYAGAITDHGTFNYASSANQTLAGIIFGEGSLTQSGSGTLTLTNANTYLGGTVISAGTLDINATGSIQGNVSVTAGVLELDNAAALVPSAVLTLASSPTANAVNLNFSGVQTVGALNFGSTPMLAGTYGALGNGSVTYQNAAFTGSGILNVSGQAAYWDPSPSLGALPGNGGTGSWDASTPDWFNGTADAAWGADNIATFAGSAGTVTLNASLTANGLAFATGNYTVTGGSTLTLSGLGNSTPTVLIPAGNTAISCPITTDIPTNSLIVSGPGTLALSGVNTFTNSITVTGEATLSANSIADNGGSSIGNLGTFGVNPSALTLLGGNLSFTGSSGQTARTVTAQGTTTDTITVPAGDTLELDGQVHSVSSTAPQVLTFNGGGTLILGGSLNDNSGLTMAINAGLVIITKGTSATAHGLGGGTSIIGSGAELQLNGPGGFDLFNSCVLTVNSGGVFDLNGQNESMSTLTLSGSGSGGAGALINTSGNALLTNAGSGIVLAGNTTIGGSGNYTLASTISGYGMSLTYVGTGTLTLNGGNTYSGGLNLAANTTVQIAAGGGGTGTINIGNSATLILPTATTYANPIAGGSSSVIQVNEPAGNTLLTGSLSGFTGTVNCQTATTSGQLVINNINNEAYPINATATWNIASGATLDLATPFTNDLAKVIINGVGNNQIFGALRLDACNQQGNVVLAAPSCLIGDGNTTGPSTISGVISDNGFGYGFVKVGSVVAINLTGVNTYSGPTVVSNGTLGITGSGSIASSSSIDLAPGTTFDVSGANGGYSIAANQILANLSGSATVNGNLTLSSGAQLNLTNNIAAAPLVLTGGTMTLNNNPLNLAIANTVSPTANGYLLIAATNGGVVAGNVSSSSVTINGQPVAAGGPHPAIINGSLYLVAGPPDIMVGPVPANPIIFASNNISFSVIVFGAPTLTNQWYTNGTPVPGATNTSVTLTSVPVGSYTVTFGSTNSFSPSAASSTTLTVQAPPTTSFAQSVLTLNPIGYWRLNEAEAGAGNQGVICHDYIAGNDGIYSNTILANLGFDSVDANVVGDTNYDSETSAEFGQYSAPDSCAYNIPNIDFSAPTNKSATFTVQAWVQCPNTISTAINTPGVVGKGIFGSEEFTIDCGTHIGTVDAYRFSVRNAGAAVFNANSALIAGNDTNWHFLVGVCDQVHSNVTLYIDGTNVSTVIMPPGSGIASNSASFPMSIGSRSSAGTSYDQQFTGFINDVAIFTNALTASQVQNLYFQAGIPPTVSLASNNITVNEFGTTLMPSFPYGSPSLATQWYLTDTSNNVTAIPGQTNALLTLTNVQSWYYNVFAVVTNAYGSATSAPAYLTVNNGPASIFIDTTPALVDVPPGTMLTYSVLAYGALPISYEWLLNGSTVIPGATNASYTFPALLGTNTYTCGVSNSQNGSYNTGHAVTVVANNTPPVVGFDNPSLWSLQHTGTFSPTISGGGVLEITSAAVNESCSAFYEIPQFISNGFTATYTYTPSGGSATRADGVTFVLQNSTNGFQALGAGGGDLGVTGIAPCVNFNLDIFTNVPGGAGINWATNGGTAQAGGGAPNGGTSPVNINSLDPIGVQISYSSATSNVLVVLTDVTHTNLTYTTNYATGNLATMLGSVTAYVGFTGGTGGSDAEQQISDFNFVYTAAQEAPVVLDDISPTNMDAPVGAIISYSVGVIGTAPLYYHWYENGTVVPGATNSSYTFAATAGSNTFQCGISNSVSGSTNTLSDLAYVAASTTPPVIDLGNSSLWQWQGTVANLTGGILTLTTAAASETGSGYYTIPQYINNGFVASFTYTPSAGTATRADGTAFVLQNSVDGPFALGAGGGDLGVTGTAPSVNLNLDLFSGASGGTGISLGTNGTTAQTGGAPNAGTAPVNINSLDPINVTVAYHPELGEIQVKLIDTVSNLSYSTNYPMGNLAANAGGDSAYVGFTGGTGSDNAGQQISNFAFTYTGPAAAIIQDLAPLNITAYVGVSIPYSVVASGDQPISYAWFVNSNLVVGATNSTYTLVVPGVGSTTVQCGVSNSFNGSYALSSVATVVGIPAPTDSYATNLLASGPVAYWRLNEANGSTTAFDYVGGFNGTYGANTTNGQPGIPNPPFLGVPTNDLGVFMDNNVASAAGFVTTPPLNITVTTCTLTCWVKPSGGENNSAGLVFSRGSPVNNVCGINYGASNEMAYTWNGNAATYDWTSGLIIPSNQWSLLALVITPANAVAYVINSNGMVLNTNNVANTPALINSGFTIGADPQTLPARIFNGEMDEVAVFASALSSNQVSQIYADAGFQSGPPVPPTITINRTGPNIVITWSAGNLFSAPTVKGPWTIVTNAVSPYTTNSLPANVQFFKSGIPFP